MKSWSSTQAVIALSSGEAEYYGMVRGGSTGIGFRSILEDLGIKAKVRVSTDASAAKGIACRRGLGKVRHIEVNQLWLQQKVATGNIEVRKVKGEDNLADALTKYLGKGGVDKHIECTNQEQAKGRHWLAPAVSGNEIPTGENWKEEEDEEDFRTEQAN